MKIYLAGSFKARDDLITIARQVEATDEHTVTSRWLWQSVNEQAVTDGMVTDMSMARRHARQDIDDIDRSDMVVIFTKWPSSTGGLHWEYGYCFGQRKRVVVVGPIISVFFALPFALNHFPSPDGFVKWVLS